MYFWDYVCLDHLLAWSWDTASEHMWTWLWSWNAHLGQSISHSLSIAMPLKRLLPPACSCCWFVLWMSCHLSSTGWSFFHSEWVQLTQTVFVIVLLELLFWSEGLSTATSTTIAGERHGRKFLGIVLWDLL